MIEKGIVSAGKNSRPARAGSYANGRASRSEPGRMVCDVLSICLKLHVTFVMALSLLSLLSAQMCRDIQYHIIFRSQMRNLTYVSSLS